MNAAPDPNEITFETLTDYVEGRLSPQRVAEVEAYLRTNPDAQVEVAWIRETVAALSGEGWEAPPPELSAQVKEAYRDNRRNSDSLLAALFTPRFVAVGALMVGIAVTAIALLMMMDSK